MVNRNCKVNYEIKPEGKCNQLENLRWANEPMKKHWGPKSQTAINI